jgi:hypothetical protein
MAADRRDPLGAMHRPVMTVAAVVLDHGSGAVVERVVGQEARFGGRRRCCRHDEDR